MKKYPFLLVAILFLFGAFFPSETYCREKITVAVLDFEAKNMNQESADAVTDILRTELFNTGRFKVVEREKIRRLIDEQSFQMSGMTDSDQAAEIGRLLNVEKIMVGTVTRLGNANLINIRMVDVQSGLVVLAEKVECRGGEEKLLEAIVELAINISFKIGLEGSIIRIDEDNIFVDLGKGDGVDSGHKFNVYRSGETIVDLEGRVIGTSDEIIGTIEVVKVQDRFSVAEVRERSRKFQRGDQVKPAGQEKFIPPKRPRKTEPKKEVKSEPKEEVKSDKKKLDVPVIF